jgi:hypothetical protein
MTVRFTSSGDGYRQYSDGRIGEATGYAYEHRLVALAWGLIDSLDDPREIHHLDGSTDINIESNLLAVDEEDHANYHLHVADDRDDLDEWVTEKLPSEVVDRALDEAPSPSTPSDPSMVVLADGGRSEANE